MSITPILTRDEHDALAVETIASVVCEYCEVDRATLFDTRVRGFLTDGAFSNAKARALTMLLLSRFGMNVPTIANLTNVPRVNVYRHLTSAENSTPASLVERLEARIYIEEGGNDGE